MTQKYYNFEKLTPDKDADISVYEEAIEFVFDNSDVTNIAISGAYGAGKSSIIESYEKKHDDKNFLHISLAHFEPTERNESEDSVKETTLEGKILNQLIHQIPVDRIPQTNFRVKKDVGRRNIIIITILLYVLLGSITFISMSNKIQNWVDALCDGRLKSLLAIFTNDFTVFLAGIAFVGSVFICIYNVVKVQKNKNLFHKVTVQGNTIDIFENKDEFVKQSNNLARHLYDQSIHPHISNGEFYVIYIDGCIINDETVDAVMLLKTEAKDNFLTVSYENGEYSIKSQLGLSTKHLDKGCIIFNTQSDNGYLISIVETSTIRQDGRYWSNNFLYIKEIITDFQHTEHIADFCSTVVRQISKGNPEKSLDLVKASRKIIQILQNEGREVNTNELISSLAIDEEVASMLLSYKREYEERSGEMPETFKIAQNAAKRKAITKANILKIGSGFELKVLDSSAIIEQGYDDEKKQNFLKLYYR